MDYGVKNLLNSSYVNTNRTLKLACATDSELIIPAGKSTKSSAANIKVQVPPAEYWYIFNGHIRRKFGGLSSFCSPPKMAPQDFSRDSTSHIPRKFPRKLSGLGPRLSIFFHKSAEVNGSLIDRFGFDGSTCSIEAHRVGRWRDLLIGTTGEGEAARNAVDGEQ